MKFRIIYSVFLITVSAVISVLLYEPVRVSIFKLTEPRFAYPVYSSGKAVYIRNDASGDGEFGAKRRNGRSHSGIDIKASIGSPVYASKSGLAFRGNVPTGYGKYVMIYHPDGVQTLYAHLKDWAINPVQKVRRGDLIGYVGKTGNASSKNMLPHLHFEIRKDGVPQDPNGVMK